MSVHPKANNQFINGSTIYKIRKRLLADAFLQLTFIIGHISYVQTIIKEITSRVPQYGSDESATSARSFFVPVDFVLAFCS